MTVITFKIAIIPFILITSQSSIGLTFAVLQKTLCISLFYTQTLNASSMELWDVIKMKGMIAILKVITVI